MAFSCTCIGEIKLRREIKNTDLIVVGKILSKKILQEVSNEQTDQRFLIRTAEYTVLIENVLKGMATHDTLKIHTGIGSGDCGYVFETGKKYIIYSNITQSSLLNTEQYYTSICTRTALFSDAKLNKILRFRRLLKK